MYELLVKVFCGCLFKLQIYKILQQQQKIKKNRKLWMIGFGFISGDLNKL